MKKICSILMLYMEKSDLDERLVFLREQSEGSLGDLLDKCLTLQCLYF